MVSDKQLELESEVAGQMGAQDAITMVSDKQLEANRRNAQRSTGPRTPEGKEAVRFNSLKHGLRAEACDVLPNEDPERFAAGLDAWQRSFPPTNEAGAQLVHRAAVVSWRLDRAERYENAVSTQRVNNAVNACDCADDDSTALHEAATLASFDPSPEGERLRRYQSSLTREMFRIIDLLAKLARTAEKAAPPNKPISQAAQAHAPSKPISQAAQAPNKPISSTVPAQAPNKPISLVAQAQAPNKPISTGSVANRPASPRPESSMMGLTKVGWLNVSCLKS